jgi:two-component system phosphate regulon response regulator PhoB
MSAKVLIIEDDQDVADLIIHILGRSDFKTLHTLEGEEGILLAEEEQPDIILLDWMLPDVPGIEICRQLRRKDETQEIPIIMLTARGDEADRIRGLETGADDYITKPFSVNELVARVNAVLRRFRPALVGGSLDFEGIFLDPKQHRVSRDDVSLHLGPTEYRLLLHFMESPGRVYSREQLLDAVWGHDVYVEIRTVDVHIRRLRKALNFDDKPNLIRTVRSAGYSLDKV